MQNRAGVFAFAVLPLLAIPVSAQDRSAPLPASSRVELFVGLEQQAIFGATARPASLPTWESHIRFGADWNVTDRVALVLSAPSFGVASGPNSNSTIQYAFLAGPRFRFRPQQRVMPFVQVLFGVEHRNDFFGTKAQAAVGAGADIRLNDRFAWRVLQVEERSLFGGHLDELDGNHRLSLSTGLVIRFGARK